MQYQSVNKTANIYELANVQWWGYGWLGLSKLITKGNREGFNLFWDKAELNVDYKKKQQNLEENNEIPWNLSTKKFQGFI